MNGFFDEYGGRYVPEMLQAELIKLADGYDNLKITEKFKNELNDLQTKFNNRPTPLVFAENLTKEIGGAQIYLKNEGMNHTGAHKINHCLGQALVARHLGKTRIVAETGAGQHGVATATVAAKFGLKCRVYMGEVDINRQRPNVAMMELLGAEVITVKHGSRTLKDAVGATIRDWLQNTDDTHYIIGSCLGPDPYPRMNRDFQSIVGREIRTQLGSSPDYIIACVGGGSNAMGAFYNFIDNSEVSLIGVEAGGRGPSVGDHASRFPDAKVGIMDGYKSYFLQDDDGNTALTHSIAAGLDYIGIGPELAYLHDTGRVIFERILDEEALDAVSILARTEGIIPALESAHAVAFGIKLSKTLDASKNIVITVSGRGDKDLFTLAKHFSRDKFYTFLKEEVANYE
jgi:tryptophan synthase beta chain